MKKVQKYLFVYLLSIPLSIGATEINFSGFATIAGGMTLDDEQNLYGYDDNFALSNNSLFAIQASSDLGNGWGVTTQLLARGENDWDLDAEWAFISYDVNNEFRLLFGRQRASFYMYSDFLDVSYAYHWITPPTGVYSLPFDLIDGVSAIYTSSFGSFDSTLHASYGKNEQEFELLGDTVQPTFEDFASIAWTINRDWFTTRLSYARTTTTIPIAAFQPLLDGWNSTPFASVADALEAKDDDSYFVGLAISIDYEDYIAVFESTKLVPGNNALASSDSYYVSFGKRFDDILVHFTFGADKEITPDSIVSDVPVGVNPMLDFLVATTTGIMNSQADEDTEFYTLGLRWEVSDSISFKAEYTDFEDNTYSNNKSLIQFALTTVF